MLVHPSILRNVAFYGGFDFAPTAIDVKLGFVSKRRTRNKRKKMLRVRSSVASVAAAASRSCGVLQREASSATSVHPASISLLKASPPSPSYKGLELEYDQGQKLCLSAEFLRVYSPSADSMRTTARGKKKIISGRRHVHILGIEPIGKYGIRIIYDDTHDTGIYTWTYLHDLGSKKFYYMREYIKSLWEAGLSREPGKKK